MVGPEKKLSKNSKAFFTQNSKEDKKTKQKNRSEAYVSFIIIIHVSFIVQTEKEIPRVRT